MENNMIIDKVAFNQNSNRIDDLKLAMDKITHCQQEQFEQLKGEKWYTRVFDLITFSNKKDIRMANQIGTLAQAQEVLGELLATLSENDKDVSQLLLEKSYEVQILSKQNVRLANKYVQLDSYVKHGDLKRYTLNSLNKEERNTLVFCLWYLSRNSIDTNNKQKGFVSDVLRHLNVNYSENYDEEKEFKLLYNISNTHRKKVIILACMLYLYMNTGDIETIEFVDDNLTENFDIGKKTLDELKKYLKGSLNLLGEKGLAYDLIGNTNMVHDINFFSHSDIKQKILVLGSEKVGKTTLIKSIGKTLNFNFEIMRKDNISIAFDLNNTICFYELDTTNLNNNISMITDAIDQGANIIFYCINGERITKSELEFINKVSTQFNELSIYIVLTQYIGDNANSFKANLPDNLKHINVLTVLAENIKTKLGVVEKYGLDKFASIINEKL